MLMNAMAKYRGKPMPYLGELKSAIKRKENLERIIPVAETIGWRSLRPKL